MDSAHTKNILRVMRSTAKSMSLRLRSAETMMKRQLRREGREKIKSDAFREDAGEKDVWNETDGKKSGADHKASDGICI